LKLWQLLHTYWLPNSYWNWQEYVVSVMLIAVRNNKVNFEWYKAIKLNYKNTRTRVTVVVRLPSTLRRPQLMLSCDVKVSVRGLARIQKGFRLRFGITPMREAILRVDRRGLRWTIWRMFSRVLIVRTTSLSNCKETLGREQVSRNVWWIRVNTLRDGILQSGKRLWYSWTAARALPLQNPYTKCVSQYYTWKKTKGMCALHKSPTYCSAHAKVTG